MASAEPTLASQILLSASKRLTLKIGVKAIDNALDGGLEYGSVHCIIPELDQGARGMIQTLLTSHLLSSENSTATIIDSTLSFDVRQLFQVLEASLCDDTGNAKDQAMKALDRVKIMKVFDFEGLTEAMSEVRETLEYPDQPAAEEIPTIKVPKSTIPDSEDEDEDEMLDTVEEPPPHPIVHPLSENAHARGMLIIDNISQVMAPLIKNNYTQGQASLASFMRSLSHLTRAYELCTVVISSAGNKPATDLEALSMFGSCTIRPALGVGFGSLVDVLIYLHSVSVKKPADSKQVRSAEVVSILEVVQDRDGERFGRWAPFICTSDDRLEAVP